MEIKEFEDNFSRFNNFLSSFVEDNLLYQSKENSSDLSDFFKFIKSSAKYLNFLFSSEDKNSFFNKYHDLLFSIFYLKNNNKISNKIKKELDSILFLEEYIEFFESKTSFIKKDKFKIAKENFIFFVNNLSSQDLKDSLSDKTFVRSVKYYSFLILDNLNDFNKNDIIGAFLFIYYFERSSLKKYYSNVLELIPNISNHIFNEDFVYSDDIKKNNLLELRKMFQNLSDIYKEKWICSVDIEFVKLHNQIVIFELGYTLRRSGSTKKLFVKNFVIKDSPFFKKLYKSPNLCLSKHTTLEEAIQELNKDFERVKSFGGILVGNGIRFDIEELKKHNAVFNTDTIIDISDMLSFFDKNNEFISLKNICDITNIKTYNLHNASNDAYYSTIVFGKLMSYFSENSHKEIIKKSFDKKLFQDNVPGIHTTTYIKKNTLTQRKLNFIIYNIDSFEKIEEYVFNSFHSYETIDFNYFIKDISTLIKKRIDNSRFSKKHLLSKIFLNFSNLQIVSFENKQFITLEDSLVIFKYFVNEFNVLNTQDLNDILKFSFSLRQIDEKENKFKMLSFKDFYENINNNSKKNNACLSIN